jgi:DNA (cytosine-5)-methyltransferase 1
VGAGFPFASLNYPQLKLVGLCEQDPWCSSLLSQRFPHAPIYPNIKTLPLEQLKTQSIDLITASPPCQPFSIQGKRKGSADPRDCLPFFVQAIQSIQPYFFCLENVTGLLSVRNRDSSLYFQHFLQQISSCGYNAQWLCLSSGHFGAPFLRERLLVVGVSQRLKFSPLPSGWSEQVRVSIEKVRSHRSQRGLRPGFPLQMLQSPNNLPRPLGIPSGNSTVRRQRQAMGNILDPQLAQVALERVLYLCSLCS